VVGADTERLLALALGSGSEPVGDELGERVVDAALALVAASGMRHLTMDDVARRAGVGRMTVYRRFGTRQALLDALAQREARRCLAEIAGSFDPAEPLADRAADVFVAVIRVIGEHPLLARLARVEPEALLRELTREGSVVFGAVLAFLTAQVLSAQEAGELPLGDPAPLAELALRLGASFVLIPGGVLTQGDERTMRATVRALVAGLSRRSVYE
jgi:AcrR family transcriptional regulator